MKKSTLILAVGILSFMAGPVQAQDIFDAVRNNEITEVRTLVAADPQRVYARDANGRTPLHWACRGVRFEILKFLVAKGADVNAKDDDGTTPLHSLAAKAHSEGIAFLLTNQGDANARNARGETPLHSAAQSGSIAVVNQLIDHGADVSSKSYGGFTPLLRAVQANSLEIAELLMSKGAEIDVVLLEDYYGSTALTMGVRNGNLEMVKMLLQRGANIQFRTKLGENYLHFAAAINRADVVEYLIGCGIDVNSAKNGGLTSLHLAAFTGSLDAAKQLVEKGANLDLESQDGGTPLHYAVAARNHELADFLRANGAKDTPRTFPKYKGKYLGQKAPGTEPELFIPELFRDIYRSYSTPGFSPDGKEMFLNVYLMPGIDYNRIWWMKEEKGRWTAPVLAPFSDFPSWQAALSHDGKKICFASKRPKEEDHSDFCDLWFAEKQQDGTWSLAKPLGSPPNRDTFNEMLPLLAKDGTVYFKAFGPGARGTQMYKSKYLDGRYTEPQSLDDLIDSNAVDDCTDQEYLVTYAYGGPRHAEISICFHKPDGRWTRPLYMGDQVHQGQGTVGGKISSDGKYFFFNQNISPYWVDASFIKKLRIEASKHGNH